MKFSRAEKNTSDCHFSGDRYVGTVNVNAAPCSSDDNNMVMTAMFHANTMNVLHQQHL